LLRNAGGQVSPEHPCAPIPKWHPPSKREEIVSRD
jgi:hypothetical protein